MRRIATSLIFGTIPVLVIGFAQWIFKFNDSQGFLEALLFGICWMSG